MSSSDYTITPNLGLFRPNYDMDDGLWGTHLNANADKLDALFVPGGTLAFLPLSGGTVTAPDGQPALTVNAHKTQTTEDFHFNHYISTVDYTADSPGGDNLAFGSYMVMRPNGHQVMNSQHTSGLYGNAYLDNDGNAASHCAALNGGMFVTGNGGPGTLDNGMDVRGHPNFNNGGGHITNHYFLYQEISTAATNEYGAYFSAPIGIGNTAPTFNLQISCNAGGNVNFTNGLLVDFSDYGSLYVTRNGMSLYPGFSPGKGGFGCMDLVVGFNGSPNATNATSGFLYISACPGPPTAAPAVAAAGRVAMTYDTTTHKLWVHDGTVWRGVVVS